MYKQALCKAKQENGAQPLDSQDWEPYTYIVGISPYLTLETNMATQTVNAVKCGSCGLLVKTVCEDRDITIAVPLHQAEVGVDGFAKKILRYDALAVDCQGGGARAAVLAVDYPQPTFPRKNCGANMGWDRPSGVCSTHCLYEAQGFKQERDGA